MIEWRSRWALNSAQLGPDRLSLEFEIALGRSPFASRPLTDDLLLLCLPICKSAPIFQLVCVLTATSIKQAIRLNLHPTFACQRRPARCN